MIVRIIKGKESVFNGQRVEVTAINECFVELDVKKISTKGLISKLEKNISKRINFKKKHGLL